MPLSYSDQITIEKSPSYFRTDSVPKRIFDMNPKMKLILIVCSPIKRTVSIYTHMLAHKSRLKFDQSKHHNHSEHLASEVFDKNGKVIIDNEERNLEAKKGNLIYDSLYVVHLKKWLEYFPLEQFLILSGEEFIKNPYNEVMKVEKFLNLKSFFKPEHYVFDQNKGFYCLNKDVIKSKENPCLGDNKGRKHYEISSTVLEKLSKFYKPYSLEFFELIKQEPFWEI
jgi:hypothetical protein